MAINNLQEKYLTELSHIHDSEHRFVAAQQEMQAQATDPALKAGLKSTSHRPNNRSRICTRSMACSVWIPSAPSAASAPG